MPRGFLLHSRPYRETSLIATFVTDTEGRIDLIARSARTGRNRKSPPPLPFSLYELSWVGKSELKHLQFFESLAPTMTLSGSSLYCGFYLNELLYRLLPRHGPEYQLLTRYEESLRELSATDDVEPVLRRFELSLLEALGYGLDFSCDGDGMPLQAGSNYVFVPEQGLTRTFSSGGSAGIDGSAEAFAAIGRGDFAGEEVRQLAKRVLRASLAVYLGNRPLRSRELFVR